MAHNHEATAGLRYASPLRPSPVIQIKDDHMEDSIVMGFVGCTLLFIFFIPTSWIVYRNLDFRIPLKFTYSLTVVPLFIFLMAKNYFWIADHFPKLVELYGSVAQKSNKGGSIIAFLLTCPLSLFGCYVWYKIHDIINKKLFSATQQKIPTNQNDEVERERSVFQLKWMGYLTLAILVNLPIGLSILNVLDKAKYPISPVGIIAIVSALPLLVIVFYFRKRSSINKSNV